LKIPREMFGGGAITQDARPGKLPGDVPGLSF